MGETFALTPLLAALHFAADKHRDQRRKNAEASPYINHPIEAAELLARVGGVTHTPPAKWSVDRRKEYLDWTEQVVAGLCGCNPPLEKLYDELLAEGRRVLSRL